ncbi:MAG: TetR/AcrR family transcriptional regulator [Armatimonadetes bacterium]|nr:TetR/AcrR family transcriptional regulator [Armatimonadota bacterium]
MPRVASHARAQLKDVRRTQILEAAARVFAWKGFDRATITEIAQAAGLSEGSIYNYFRSKEELLVHIPRQLVQPALMPLGAEAAPRDLDGVEQMLVGIGTAMVDRVRTYAPFLKVFLSALPALSPAVREKYMQILPFTYGPEMLERFLREGILRGLFRKDLNPVIAARMLPGMLILFLMVQEVLLGRTIVPYGYDEIIPEAVRVFLYGTARRGVQARQTRKRGRRT